MHLVVDLGDDIGHPNWPSLFERFQDSRKPDADAIADLALRNFVEMRDKVADPRFLLQKRLETALASRFPGRYTPIYSHVTFSGIPYSEALRLSKVQQVFLDRILEGREKLDDVDWVAVEDLL